MNNKLKIRTESLPERCEICHQADCFDATTNHCSRCADITINTYQRSIISVHSSLPYTPTHWVEKEINGIFTPPKNSDMTSLPIVVSSLLTDLSNIVDSEKLSHYTKVRFYIVIIIIAMLLNCLLSLIQ
ncbi:MAG: hypothetical protein AB1489_12010 [Acidobacteriota bacterium]